MQWQWYEQNCLSNMGEPSPVGSEADKLNEHSNAGIEKALKGEHGSNDELEKKKSFEQPRVSKRRPGKGRHSNRVDLVSSRHKCWSDLLELPLIVRGGVRVKNNALKCITRFF